MLGKTDEHEWCIFLPLHDHVSVCAGSRGIGPPLSQTA